MKKGGWRKDYYVTYDHANARWTVGVGGGIQGTMTIHEAGRKAKKLNQQGKKPGGK